MIHQNEFRDPQLAKLQLQAINQAATHLNRTITLMEVCGTHTMAIHQHGIRGLLPRQIRLISGPGCPVCVTPVDYIDHAIALARRPKTIIATFGDLLRVPGSSSSLIKEQAAGGNIAIIYSALDALKLAEKETKQTIVFLSVGFETTAPTVAGTILTATQKNIKNFYILSAHKTMPAPMAVLAGDPELQVDGYLCPAHVSAIIGARAYEPLVENYHVPCVITGFEPLDILQGVLMLTRQLAHNRFSVENQYRRVVKPDGNAQARNILFRVFEPCDAQWRGIGNIPASGLMLRQEYNCFDAARKLPVSIESTREHGGCLCGEVLKGKIKPSHCPLFGNLCTPEDPVGACMVSSEGACAAEYKYGTNPP